MKHVKLDGQADPIKRFVLALTAEAGGSMLELNGKPVACVLRPPRSASTATGSQAWTDAKNNRRCDLIDREIDGVITPDEAVELSQLQEELLHFQQRIAAWPIQAARQLQQKLLKKVAKAKHGSKS